MVTDTFSGGKASEKVSVTFSESSQTGGGRQSFRTEKVSVTISEKVSVTFSRVRFRDAVNIKTS